MINKWAALYIVKSSPQINGLHRFIIALNYISASSVNLW